MWYSKRAFVSGSCSWFKTKGGKSEHSPTFGWGDR